MLSQISLHADSPLLALSKWRDEAIQFLAALNFDADHTKKQTSSLLSETPANRVTHDRLIALEAALNFNRAAFLKLLKPLIEHPLLNGFPRVPAVGGSAVMPTFASNLANVFRDWAWPEAETLEHLQFFNTLLPNEPLGRVLILGAGSARLAFDLARTRECTKIIATEINPLLFLVAEKMLNGETVDLFEIAELPVRSAFAAKKHTLHAPHSQTALSSPIELVLTDFFEDHFEAESFDLVITPWFVDVVGAPLAQSADRIHQMLKNGGRWVNIGPLMFQTNERKNLLTIDEVVEDLEAHNFGFKLERSEETEITQLKSTLSATYRTDRVFGWAAEKLSVAETSTKQKLLNEKASAIESATRPNYLVDYRRPVTLAQALPGLDLEEIAQSHHLLSTVLQACHEGESIEQISNRLAPDFGLPTEAVAPIVAGVIESFYRSQTGRSL